MDIHIIEDEVRRIAPELFPAAISPLGEGLNNRAVLVGGTYVFRFAKHREGSERMGVEAMLLPKLAPWLNLPIPRPEYHGRQAGSGLLFSGYRMIRGEELTPARLAALPGPARERIVRELADFLAVLHAFPVEEARACGVGTADFRASARSDLERARAEVFPITGEGVWQLVERSFADYLADEANFAYRPCLLHTDLAPEHVLLAEDGSRIAGVLDFDAEIGDPDYDLAYPSWAGLLDELLRYDPHPDIPRLRRKLRFFEVREAVDDVLIGLDRRNDTFFKMGLSALERLKEEG